jgi:hypothetical protein
MAIYQIPTDNVGVTKTFAGTIKDSANNPIEGAVIALRRKGGSDYVAYTETDANGDYSFTIDADGDFVISYKLSHDPNAAITETDELSPANPFSYYDDNDNNTGYYACVGIDNFPQSAGSGPTWCVDVPTAEVVDAGPYLLNDAILTYGFTGPGEGAKVSVSLCPSGGYYASYSSRVLFDHDPQGGIGYPLHRYNITSFGRNYQNPALKLTGTVVQTFGGSLQNAIDAGFTTAFEFNGSTFYTETKSWYYQITGRQLELGVSQIESYWGADHSLWGTYQSDYNGGKFTVALPGEQDRFDFDTTDYDESIFTEAFTNPDTVLKHGMQLYYKVIYGPGGIPGAPTGDSTTSAIKAQQAKVISQEELDIVKGYFGKIGIVAELTGQTGLTATTIANTLNFGYQMTQAITTYLTNVRNNAGDPWDLSVGYTAGYSGTNSSVFTNIYREWQSFQRQKKGTDIPEADFGTKVFPILQKMGMTTVQTPYDGGWRTWTFSTSGVTSRAGL